MTVEINVNKATGSNFQLVIPKLPSETSLTAQDELILNLYGCAIPGVNFNQEDLRWQAWKLQAAVAPVEFQPWTFTFTVDADFKNWRVIFDWMMWINNNLNIAGRVEKLGDPETYVVDCSLKILDNFQRRVFDITFRNVWPQSLDDVMMSQREGEVDLEATCTLVYDRYEVVD